MGSVWTHFTVRMFGVIFKKIIKRDRSMIKKGRSMTEACPEFLKLRYWWNKEVLPLLPGCRDVSLEKGVGGPRVRAVSDVSMDRVF